VLVVEDEELMRAAIADELRAHAYAVVEAPTADDALAIMKSGVQVDLVLTDVRMPGTLDGLALARLIRARYPKIKIVITSGNSSDDVEKAADTFFAKPYDFERVVACVGCLLSREE
jgi:two-component system, response regulator PdtaR